MTRSQRTASRASAAKRPRALSPSAQRRQTARPAKSRSRFFSDSFPIVGVGASAGGLEAFSDLLTHVPPDTGLGFVVVQHLDPQHDSALPQLLARVTSMPVLEVINNLRVEPNRVYVIPPNTNLTIERGLLKLQPRQHAQVARSIDSFLESLAQDRHERAIGVILSGTASDGTLGLEAIKAEGGITFAQDDSARYDSMPRSAVAAGCVDFLLSPENIAKELTRIAKHPYVGGPVPARLAAPGGETPLPARAGGRLAAHVAASGAASRSHGATVQRAGRHEEHGYRNILTLLRNHSGVDFSLYKSTTIRRRIQRRMVLNKRDTLEHYAALLRGNAPELAALYSDALINVTSFLRNPEAFEILKTTVFPTLLQQRTSDPLRVWVLGCSTGQEAYSIAIAFEESVEHAPRARTLQVFATDLNDALLDKARHGLYAKSLAADLSPERLRRFFVEEEGGYRVGKRLRDMIVFARQNLIRDPPFSRMDLISCRNLLIYLESSVQRTVLPTFHYALKPHGFLFLGAAESIGTFTDLFQPVDKKHKLYSKKAGGASAIHPPLAGGLGGRSRGHSRPLGPTFSMGRGRVDASGDVPADLTAQREADRVMIAQFAPAGVLINAELHVLRFRGPTSTYLQPPTGKASFDVLNMARDGLIMPLRALINRAKKNNTAVRRDNVRFDLHGQARTVHLQVLPLKNLRERSFLILFEEARTARRLALAAPSPPRAESRGKQRAAAAKDTSRRVAELERELTETRDYLQSIQDQYEAANEELQAANEEVTSANEELQSMNEELETSKEELESANEELTTVNEEMANRNTVLNRLTSDLTNLQTSTQLAIVLLGRDLTIKRFSEHAAQQFNLRATDAGRLFTGVRHNLDVPDLEAMLADVIANVRQWERDVRDRNGRWYSLRARPYLTIDNTVDGAVLVLVDIDALKRSEHAIAEAREHSEAIIRTVPDPLVILTADLRVQSANDAFYRLFRLSPGDTEGRPILELDHGSWNVPELRHLLEDILPRNSVFNDFELAHTFELIGRRVMLLNARMLNESAGKPKEILLGIRDISDVLAFQADLRRSELRYRRLFESARDGVLLVDAKTRTIVDANPFVCDLLGYTRDELRNKGLFDIAPLTDRATNDDAFLKLQAEGHIHYEDLPLQTKQGERLDVEFISTLYREDGDTVIQCNMRDISGRKATETRLREAQAELANRAAQLEHIVAERTEELTATNKQLEAFAYSIAHDLRAPLRAMQGFAEILVEEEGAALSDSGKTYADRISASAQFMDVLLRDLLAFSRISQHRAELTAVNLATVVESMLSRLQKDVRDAHARVDLSGPWPVVLAHEPTLAQVLLNLMNNALKFAAADRPPVVRLRTEERADFIRVWVEDNGVGIAPDHQDQVFRLFTRLHGEKYPGTGIGLAIVQKGIERMGGRVGLESALGEGSRFWFELRKA